MRIIGWSSDVCSSDLVDQGQAIDHVAGVACRIVHRGHARAMLARRVLQQRLEDLHGDVGRQQRGEDLLLAGLVLIDGAVEAPILSAFDRSEERRVGYERGITGIPRGYSTNLKK